jgi:hypothetical protein
MPPCLLVNCAQRNSCAEKLFSHWRGKVCLETQIAQTYQTGIYLPILISGGKVVKRNAKLIVEYKISLSWNYLNVVLKVDIG